MHKMIVDVEMTDGTIHKDVTLILADQVAYSTVRQRHKWPTLEEDMLLGANFMTYHALTRLVLFVGNWDQFCEQCVIVSSHDVEEVEPIP